VTALFDEQRIEFSFGDDEYFQFGDAVNLLAIKGSE
jgi:hypothetical protein